MTITREYCDRCNKQISPSRYDDPLHQRLSKFPIVLSRPKYEIFNVHIMDPETGEGTSKRTSMIFCNECLKGFWDWFEEKPPVWSSDTTEVEHE